MTDPFTPADVTVSLIARHRPALLGAALASVAETTDPRVTIQLLLNPPREDVRAVVDAFAQRWDGRVVVYETHDSLNFVDAHNHALSLVQTRLVNFMGDDDVNLGPRIGRQLEVLNGDPRVVVCGTYALRIGGSRAEDRNVGGRMAIGPRTAEECDALIRSGEIVHLVFPTALARVDVIRSVGGFRPQFGVAADVDLWSRLAERGAVVSVPDYMFGFRVHDRSGSTALFLEADRGTHYARACAAARSRGEAEPTMEEWDRQWHARPLLRRLTARANAASRLYFRRAGAAYVEGRRVDMLRYLGASAVLSPRAALGKLREQRG